MVHKKYIKRDGKTFGPYLYQNYRENGITKTKYLGLAKERKKMRVNLLWIVGIIILILLLIGSIGFFVVSDKEELKGELESKSPFDFLTKLFTTSSPVNVFVQIVSNHAPEILNVDDEILVCENKILNHPFLIRDDDGVNDLKIASITPKDPFFIEPKGNDTYNYAKYEIFSYKLIKFYFDATHRKNNQGWAVYPETIYAEDEKGEHDIFDTNITIIEVNNAPEFDIGVQTIDLYLKGENTSFYYDLGSELEEGFEETPKQYLKYNLTYQNGLISPFNISRLGVINISGNESYILSGDFTNYPLRVCVNDTGLRGAGVNRILHPEISKCLEDNPPQSADPLGWCDKFILTITKKNREPNITSYYPLNISSHANTNETFNRSLKISGTDILYFNLTAYDPDWTPLDVYWYVDNVSKGYYEGLEKNNVSEFEHSFGCEIFGNHSIKAVVTDGLLNDSVQWNISVDYVECPKPTSGGGGGGGGGKLYCKEKWGCNEWMQCQNLEELIKGGWPGKDTELLIKERCNLLNYTKKFCGLQNRICTDFNYCKTEFEKLPFIRECYYTENPNCTDGIKNCHNGICEVLVDCGGPCEACPTCHDKIQNQGETGIDCGGPCRPCIELPWLPVVFKSIVMYSLIALLIIILLLVARQIMKYTKFKRIFGESRIKNVLIRGGERRDENKNVTSVVMSLFFIFFVIVLLFFANAYIINFGQANKIISGVPGAGGAGLLASYGFINSIFNNLGMFFLNSLPFFTTPPDTTILGYEDTLLEYDFKNNVSDDDPGDNLTIQIDKINDTTNFQDYPWINLDSEGVLTINSTKDSETGNFKLSMKVLDSSNEGVVVNFYFNISPINDAPQFVNLENKTLDAEDLFEYIINVSDEEWSILFKFNIENNPLIDSGEYTFDEINGKINISFIPSNLDVGSYIINFSVMDNSSLGNKTTSQLVNFTVQPALWKNTVILNRLLTEEEAYTGFPLNLTEQILDYYVADVVFSYELLEDIKFPSFNISNGIINFIPDDADVGYNPVKITATSRGVSAFKIFNFTILNVNDNPIIKRPLSVDGYLSTADTNSNIQAYENTKVTIFLFAEDNDFLIPNSDEKLDINVSIEKGPNENLFNFDEGNYVSGNKSLYKAIFTPRQESIGNYSVTVNLTDKDGVSDILIFNLTINNFDYDTPHINSPDISNEFNLKEGINYSLKFNANHSVGDDLIYNFYINDALRESITGPGNGEDFIWDFTPNFTDETYENETKNLTLKVVNLYYPEFNASMTWNLTINHTNAPVQFTEIIDDRPPVSYNYAFGIDLKEHFYDADYYDAHYNQTFSHKISSNINDSKITSYLTKDLWLFLSASTSTKELLNVTLYDLDNQSNVLTNATSNNFIIEFVPPQTVPVPTPSGGSSETIPIALKIIMPSQISAYEGETIKIPLKLVNSGSKDFNEITLNSSVFKNSSLFNEIKNSLDKTYFKVLKPKQEENLTLTLYLGSSKVGKYEILVNATSKSPKYTDWGKIHLDLMPINESQVRDLIVFTKELIASNPQCAEITEILKEADKYLQAGDYANSRIKANEALNSCKEAISQVSVPRIKIPDFIKSLRLGSYLFLAIIGAIVLAIILGLIYYFIKRRDIVKLQKTVQESKGEYTKV